MQKETTNIVKTSTFKIKIFNLNIPSFHYSVSGANQIPCGYHSNVSVVNVCFAVTYGIFPDVVFCASRGFLISKRGNHLFGSAMIAMKELLSLGPIRTFMEK
jgi:hypothetical protein